MEKQKRKLPTGETIEIIISDLAVKNGFKIGNATDLEMILTDVKNEQYQADVFLKSGWNQDDLQTIIFTTLLNCDNKVKHISATLKGVISQN